MIKKLYSIYDKKAKATMGIFETTNDLVAIRDFSQVCSNKDSQIAKFAEDYQLLCLGEIDTNTGAIIPEVRVIAQAQEYAQK